MLVVYILEIGLTFHLLTAGLTIGSPIKAYSETSQACRPSRAYSLRSMQGGEISGSAKVAGGVLAEHLLKKYAGTEVLAYVSQVHKVVLPESVVDHETLTHCQIKGSTIRCPNPEYEQKMIAAINAVRVRGDSVGGTVTCIVRNFPRSRGSKAFQEIAAVLAKGVMSISLTEGFEIGRGFTGSEYSDKSGQSGGIQGGIIKMRIAVRPKILSYMVKNTVSRDKHMVEPTTGEDHDFCVVPGVAAMVEVMVARELLCKLLAEGAPTNAASHVPLKSPKSAETAIPLERSLDCFAAVFCSLV
ncbi:chorismate synthase 1, chloroplastic-like isoform X2 [Primulina huaijiensis]|uniref:chorismate synthase 1, chloroplastic-like isoform X2 n=1 Tax=Primulina huaijiensis TaxID=1492673 RepID=UPI003CC7830E